MTTITLRRLLLSTVNLTSLPFIALPVMLLLDYQNALIQSLLTERFSGYEYISPFMLRSTPPHCIQSPQAPS